MDPEDLWAIKYGTITYRELHDAIERTQRQMADIEAMKGKLGEDMDSVVMIFTAEDIRRKTHDNWPEICSCDACDTQRRQIARLHRQYAPQ